MANYLPVLLVSVANTNIVPDDSSVATLPRGQVDYLSHNWQEEDVWRSWRKMTRQKNEIANGVRLENASWRTWWKQRNKLRTVTPETLNWLKDSDVTWLYGPLHTAADWGPPTKVKVGVPDLSPSRPEQPRHKPILKHRSICEFLTSELPINSLYAPVDSENENQQAQTDVQTTSDVSDTGPIPFNLTKLKRPTLSQTKSDTHITRWSPNHGYRKDSPPRVGPPSATSEGIATSQNEEGTDGYFSQSQIRSSCSQDSSSTGASTTGLIDRQSSGTRRKKKHISFNTFVEQYIAIDKPNPPEDGQKVWGTKRVEYDDGYEEDEEDNAEEEDEVWDGRTRHPPLGGSAVAGSDSDDDEPSEEGDDDDDDDDVIEIRPRSYSNARNTPRKRAPRSPSTSASISTSSSSRSTSTSSASRSMSPSSSSHGEQVPSTQASTRVPSRRPSIASTYRPRPRLYPTSYYSSFRSGSEFELQFPGNKNPPQVHVTIAPIAPTILKTTETGYDAWAEGFGDEGGSDDGLWGGRWGPYSDQGEGWNDRDRRADDDSTTPVELVYVPPPFVGRYSMGLEIGTEDEDFDMDVEEERIEERKEVSKYRLRTAAPRTTEGSASTSSKDPSDSSAASTITPPSPNPGVTVESLSQPSSSEVRIQNNASRQVREVVPRATLNQQELHENLCRRLSGPEERSSLSVANSRSRSRSRTPSPLVDPPLLDAIQSPSNGSQLPARASSATSLPAVSSSSSLLAPPLQRGRSSSSYQDLTARGQQTRGRSSTRTPSHSDCERGSVESPIGSLSPDGSFIRVASAVGVVYASGRMDKERQKEREKREDREQYRERGRERERGRDRTGKRLSQSLSPDFESGIVMRESPSYEGRANRGASSGRLAGTRDEAHSGEGTVKSERSPGDPQSLRIPITDQASGSTDGNGARQLLRPTTTPSNSPTLSINAPSAGLVVPEAYTTISESQYLTTQTQHHSSQTPNPQPSTSATRRHTPNSVVPQDSTAPPNNSNVRSPTKVRSPSVLVPSPPHPAEPSTSLSISPPGTVDSSPVVPSPQLHAPGSPTAKEPTIVEKAVGMVSSAGAFLGLWQR